MSRRYTYSRQIRSSEGQETFTAEQFDSFDEAKKAVDKGVRDRMLEIEATLPTHKKYPTPASAMGAEVAGTQTQPDAATQPPVGK